MSDTLGKGIVLSALAFAALAVNGATVLWDEQVNGSLDPMSQAPTNTTYLVHPIGTATNDVNRVRGTIKLTPIITSNAWYNEPNEASFSFVIPSGRVFTGLTLTQTNAARTFVWGGLWASATGPTNNVSVLGGDYGWPWRDVSATNDIFATLGTSNLPSGSYSVALYPSLVVSTPWDGPLAGPSPMHYELTIYTATTAQSGNSNRRKK